MTRAAVPFIEVDGYTVPPREVLVPFSVTVGRSEAGSQPEANAAQWQHWGPLVPFYLRRGARVVIGFRGSASGEAVDLWEDVWTDVWSEALEGTPSTRFFGEITDLEARPDVERGTVTTTVTCIGRLAAFGEQLVGDEPWPVESDAQRATRLAGLLPDTLTFIPAGADVLLLRARDADRQRVLDLLHASAASTGSVLWEWPDGVVHYLNAAARADLSAIPQIVLAANEIRADLGWSQTPDTFTDRVIVEYGPDPDDGSRAAYIVGMGEREVRVSTDLEDRMSALIVGNTIYTRWSRDDLWAVPDLLTSTEILSQPTYGALLAVEPGDVLVTESLDSDPSLGDEAGLFFVEGWVETFDRPGDNLVHAFQFAVTNVERFAEPVSPAGFDLRVVVNPASWTVDNSSAQNTVTVSRVDGLNLPDVGLLSWEIDGKELTAPVESPGTPTFVEWFLEHQVGPGTHQVRAHYSGYPGLYLPAISDPFTITVTASVDYRAFLGLSTTVPHLGDTVTVYCWLTHPTNGIPEGKVNFQRSANIDGPWTTFATVDANGGDDEAMVSAPFRVANATTVFFRAEFISDDTALWNDGTSDVKTIFPLSQIPLEQTYTPTWTQSYTGSGGKIQGTDDLFQGDVGGGMGDRLGMVGYVLDRSYWTNAYVTKVELWIDWQEWVPAALSGVIRFGMHTYGGSPPDNRPATGWNISHDADVGPWGAYRSGWIDVTAWAKPVILGPETGIVVGPAAGKAPAGRALGVSSGSPPLLRVTGYRWEAADAPLPLEGGTP